MGDEVIEPDRESSVSLIASPNGYDVPLWNDLNEGCEARPSGRILQIGQRDPIQERSHFGCTVAPAHPAGRHEPPQTHERIDGRVHGDEVAQDDAGKLTPNPHLRAPTEVGGQD